MARNYRMGKRAEDRERTRERILAATMEIHDEKGVAPATFADIAARAGISQATVSRHFDSYSDLVMTCGQHVWQQMQPPTPDMAPGVFAGVRGRARRLETLVQEIDAFYRRGAHRLDLASRDRELMPELHGFLSAVEAGIGAFVAEALSPDRPGDGKLKVANALVSFRVWQAFRRQGFDGLELRALLVRTLQCGLKAADAS